MISRLLIKLKLKIRQLSFSVKLCSCKQQNWYTAAVVCSDLVVVNGTLLIYGVLWRLWCALCKLRVDLW
jgi:hypothetical protein